MPENIDIAALAQKWRHSHEEDTDDLMVFRPEAYPFPPSRGRRSFELHQDGGLINHGLGPDDRSVTTSGSWQVKGSGQLELKPGGAPSTVLTIQSVTPEKLVVKKNRL